MDQWIRELRHDTGIPVEVYSPTEEIPLTDERPRTRLSSFLSYSSMNVLVARQLFSAMQNDADLDVWFDLTKPGEAPTHRDHIENWLHDAVYSSKAFVLLLTKASMDSTWVRKEAVWAEEMAIRDPSFRFVVLRMGNTSAEWNAGACTLVVDCAYLHFHEVLEELYAAVFHRSGRRKWLEANPDVPRQLYHRSDSTENPYEAFTSEAGVAVSLTWGRAASEPVWTLEYETAGKRTNVLGWTEYDVVDPAISRGDRIGSVRELGLFGTGRRRIWMRSDKMDLMISDVVKDYEKKHFQLTELRRLS